MTWAVLNITFSLLGGFAVGYLMAMYAEKFNWLERTGIGVQGGAAVLRVGAIMSRNDLLVTSSPFDDWSGALFALGFLIAILGIIARLEGLSPGARLTVPSGEGRIGRWRHRRRNEAAARDAQRYLDGRGKL